MQDIFREAGLSAGAVYRYFPSKEDIVAAISLQAFDSLSPIVAADDGDATPSPVAMVLHLLDRIDRLEREGGEPSIALQVWSEAASVPRLADLFDQRVRGFAERLSVVIDRQREEGYDLGEDSSTSVAMVILGLLEGYIVQRVVLGELAAGRYREGVRALLPDVPTRSTKTVDMPSRTR